MGNNEPRARRSRRFTARVATVVSLLASSVLMLAPAASAQPAADISISMSAVPTSRPEPGGNFAFSISIENTGGVDLTIASLTDDVYGNLFTRTGVNTCDDLTAAQLDLDVDETINCAFVGSFTGDEGDSQTNTATVVGNPDDGALDDVTDSDSATVRITAPVDDGDTEVTVDYSVTPTSRPEPGGTFRYTVRVTNTGDEDVEITELRDSVLGDLDGEGTCELGADLDPDERYTCSFDDDFTGDAGDTRTNTVRVTVEDDNDDEAEDTDSVSIRITGDGTTEIPAGGGGTTIVVNNSSSSSSSAAAAASGGSSKPEPTPTVTVTVKPSPVPTLVRTGVESLPMGAGGFSLLMLGSLLVVTAERERRRRLYGRG